MKLKSISIFLLLTFLFSCQADQLTGAWVMTDVKPKNLFAGIRTAVEINSIYHFQSNGKFAIEGGLQKIEGKYARENDTITIERIFEGRKNSIEKHVILELTDEKLVLEDLEHGDVRVFVLGSRGSRNR